VNEFKIYLHVLAVMTVLALGFVLLCQLWPIILTLILVLAVIGAVILIQNIWGS
jgi:hypothetical protein